MASNIIIWIFLCSTITQVPATTIYRIDETRTEAEPEATFNISRYEESADEHGEQIEFKDSDKSELPLYTDKQVKDMHKDFTKQELADTFGVSHPDEVPFYETTHVEGEKHSDESELHLKAYGKALDLQLAPSKNINADEHITEFVHKDGTSTKYAGAHGKFSFGRVINDPLSHVSLHHTGRGVSGSIRTSDDYYFISPLPQRLQKDQRDHVIYRASDHATGPFIEQLKEMEGVLKNAQRDQLSKKERRNLPKKTMELMVVADWKMLEFYGKDVLPSYMLAAMNVMDGLFHDESLAYPLDIAIVKTVILETDILKGKEMYDLLNKFGKYANTQNNLDDASEDHFDAAVLITRDGCAGGGSCGIEGLANSGVACWITASFAAAQDRGFLVATSMAHEVGHILGAGHDGRSDECPNSKFIMASGGARGGASALKWSPCSSRSIAATLNSARSSCYDDIPKKKLNDPSIQLYGLEYSRDKQCQYMFGSYKGCHIASTWCASLWCMVPGGSSCKSKYFPPLHGTTCGVGKWCIMGSCVPNGRQTKKLRSIKVNGAWSSWGDFSECNKKCNIGMQWRTRKCDKPKPLNGGLLCLDQNAVRKSEEKAFYRTCNTQRCDETKPAEALFLKDRDEQCGQFEKDKIFCSYCKPYLNPCGAFCGARYSGYLAGTLKDGTMCKIDKKKEGLCVAGTCVRMGCDYKLHSGTAVDRCGVCGGDGSTCQFVTGSDETKYTEFGHWHVTTIPVNAKNAVIRENGVTKNFLALKVGDSDAWGIAPRTYRKTINLDGATISYRLIRFPFRDTIKIKGVLKVPVHIYYSNYYYRDTSKGITWTYTLMGLPPKREGVNAKWSTDEFSECSQSCGGGIKSRRVYCQRDDKSAANFEVCEAVDSNRPSRTETCATDNCPGKWRFSDWSACSRSCATGVRTRVLECFQLTVSGEVKADHAMCTDPKPSEPTSEKCNHESCPAYWAILTPFTECPSGCGGVVTQEVGCKRLDINQSLKDVPELECIGINRTGKPSTSKVCECGKWKVEYSACSVTCGAGTQRPRLICQGDHSQELPLEKCDQSKKPSDVKEKSCNLDACPSKCKWTVKNELCASGCGKGGNMIELGCEDESKMKTSYEKCVGTSTPKVQCPKTCRPVRGYPDIYPVGCYAETPSDRRVATFYADYKSTFGRSTLMSIIKSCAEGAKSKKYSFFALHNQGECWIGDANTVNTYNTAGTETNCVQGSGKENSNFVFHLGGPITLNIPPVVTYGCMPLKTFENPGSVLSSQNIVPMCGLQAFKEKRKYFSGNSDGCYSKEKIQSILESPQFTRECDEGGANHRIYTFLDN